MPEGRIFFAFVALIGAGIIGLTIFFSLQNINAMNWPQTPGTLCGSHDQFLSYSYQVDGQPYQLQMKSESLYAPKTVSVSYNEKYPRQSTTNRGLPVISIMCIIFGSVMAFFGFLNALNPPKYVHTNRFGGTFGSFPDR